jgi:hypothetical protein
MAAWIPILMAAQAAAQAAQSNNQQRRANSQQDEALEIQRMRFAQDQAQQMRDNSRQDAQGAALNPMRSNVYAALAQRLGLPPGALDFNLQQPPRGRSGAPTMPGALGGAAPSYATTRANEIGSEINRLSSGGFSRGGFANLLRPVLEQARQQQSMYQNIGGG